MIGLTTEDKSMTSHRLGFEDFGYDGAFLHSIHTPFANDADTTIETWILPLGVSHARIHKVTLNQSYYVSEGGFSLGRWDDYRPIRRYEDGIAIDNKELYSSIHTAASVDLDYIADGTQPNYHLYAPLAAYPMYQTKKPLKKGEYIFAAVFTVDRLENLGQKLLEIKICGNVVSIIDTNGKEIKKQLCGSLHRDI